MICLPNKKRACAVSSMRALVRKRIGAPLMIIVSPWRNSNTRLDISSASCLGSRARRRGCRRRVVRRLTAEQAEQRLRRLVGHGERLRAELLANLQRLQACGLL